MSEGAVSRIPVEAEEYGQQKVKGYCRGVRGFWGWSWGFLTSCRGRHVPVGTSDRLSAGTRAVNG